MRLPAFGLALSLISADILLRPCSIVIIYSPVIADTILVWRLYVIWSRDWRVTVIPLILLLASFIDGTLVIAFAGHGYGANHDGPLVALIESYYAITLTLNALVTAFIVGRLWVASRRARETGGSRDDPFTKVITALVESGTIYLVALIVYIVLYGLNVSTSLSSLRLNDKYSSTTWC